MFEKTLDFGYGSTHDAEIERQEWISTMARGRYALKAEGPETMTFEWRYIPTAAIVIAVVLFPIGLLALFIRRTSTVTVRISPNGNGSAIRVMGFAPRGVWKNAEKEISR